MNLSKLTILSSGDGLSIKSRAKFFYQANFQISKIEKNEFINRFRFGGHKALRENLILGLRCAGIEFELSNQIPINQSNIGLLAGKELLRKLTHDQKPKIGNIVVGPNLFVTPKGFEAELKNELIKKIVVPSQWVADLWTKEAPEISNKIVVWAVGIDFNYWQPLKGESENLINKVLIYMKNRDVLLINQVQSLLKENGFLVSIITYGMYSEEDYREELRSSIALVYIGESESQGIALLEAWATNVPTFVYNSKKTILIQTKTGVISLSGNNYSPAPYLTDERGHFWSDANELLVHLKDLDKYTPRKASKIFSAEICAIEYNKLFA